MKQLLLLLLVVIFFSGCKSDSSYTYYLEINDYAKSFGMFAPNSHWIYQKDTSAVTDSISVQHLLQNDVYTELGTYTEKCEGWQGRLSSANDPNARPTILLGSIDSSIIYTWFGWSLNCRYTKNSLESGNDSVTKHPTFTVQGDTYTDVYEIIHQGTPQDSFLRVNGFLESNVGLIRWDVYNIDSTVTSWTLIRKNVILQE
jgi:hypothetical protein